MPKRRNRKPSEEEYIAGLKELVIRRTDLTPWYMFYEKSMVASPQELSSKKRRKSRTIKITDLVLLTQKPVPPKTEKKQRDKNIQNEMVDMTLRALLGGKI